MAGAKKGMAGLWLWGLALILGAVACGGGVSQETLAAKDQEVASLQARLAATGQEVASLQARLAATEQNAKFWTQLTALFMPVELPSMTDHRAYMLPSGVLLALHFDNVNLSQAQNLNWVALGIPGKFCKQDQERVEKAFGPGLTHFHDLKADTHGGKPGAEGVWFVHIAVREFTAPWGPVVPGVDGKFMPTPAPACP